MADDQTIPEQAASLTGEKAFDTKELIKKLEAAGLPVLEIAAVKILGAVFDWVQESSGKSDNKYISLVIPYLPVLRAFALKQADKIAENEFGPVNDDVKSAVDEVNKVASNYELTQLPMA